MKVYIVLVEDRHHGPVPFPFADPQVALREARAWLAENLRPELVDDPELGEQPNPPGPWLLVAPYNHEGDTVSVLERDLDGPVELLGW